MYFFTYIITYQIRVFFNDLFWYCYFPGGLHFSLDFSFCSIDIHYQNYIFSQYISFSMFDYLQVLMGALPPIDFLAKSFTTTIIIRCREVSRTQVQIFCISILKFNYNHMIIFGNHICMATPFIFFNLQNNMWKDVNLTTQALKKCLGVNLEHFSYTFCFVLELTWHASVNQYCQVQWNKKSVNLDCFIIFYLYSRDFWLKGVNPTVISVYCLWCQPWIVNSTSLINATADSKGDNITVFIAAF